MKEFSPQIAWKYGLSIKALETLIEVIKTELNDGITVADGIKVGIVKFKKQFPDIKFDEAGVAEFLTNTICKEIQTPQESETPGIAAKQQAPPPAKTAAALLKAEPRKITMKLSNKARWILVLPVAVATFFGWVVLAQLLPRDLVLGDFFAAMVFATSILAGIIAAPLHGKRLLICAAALFILTCLCPPWQYTTDGNNGFHSRQPASYAPIFDPPTNPDRTYGHGVQIDFGRLILEWVVLAAITGAVWLVVIKPAWSGEDKENRPQQFIPPPGNSEN